MGVATEMGHVLRMTAHSVNIKERLDFSCAIFDAGADLVASAQHIPVHLGAMSDIVRAIMEDKGGSMAPGDVYVSNNPFRGGTHLPDVTVIEPVFSESGEVIFFVAARGHHADIGGKTPGSLPPVASHIDEEGVLLDGVLILRDGRFRERELRDILSTHKYPARNLDERISDIRAQMASCSRGVDELNAIINRYGLDTVSLYMGYIQENAEYAVKRALYGFLAGARHAVPGAGGARGSATPARHAMPARHAVPGAPGSRFESGFADALDDGTPIKVKVTIKGGKNPPDTLSACIDFTGTGLEHGSDNLNAPLPVTRSAVLYVLRTLIEADIPLNSGCLKPVEI
jgi:N-methylhydantoinase B/oxoprolinase/acetone carboxylase alpha subunit